MFNVLEFRKEFPILTKEVNSKPLVYLDNGASSQKPVSVIDAVKNCYENEYSNVHRGFCPDCGSPIISYVSEQPDIKFIKAGSLDDSSWLKIESNFWSDTANNWDPVDEKLPTFEKNPPL